MDPPWPPLAPSPFQWIRKAQVLSPPVTWNRNLHKGHVENDSCMQNNYSISVSFPFFLCSVYKSSKLDRTQLSQRNSCAGVPRCNRFCGTVQKHPKTTIFYVIRHKHKCIETTFHCGKHGPLPSDYVCCHPSGSSRLEVNMSFNSEFQTTIHTSWDCPDQQTSAIFLIFLQPTAFQANECKCSLRLSHQVSLQCREGTGLAPHRGWPTKTMTIHS